MPLSTVGVIADFQWSNVLDVVTELHKTKTSGATGLNPRRSSRSDARMARNANVVYARHRQTTFLSKHLPHPTLPPATPIRPCDDRRPGES